MDSGAAYRVWWRGVELRVEQINEMYRRLRNLKIYQGAKQMLKVSHDEAVALLDALGFPDPAKYSDQRLQDKIEGLADHVEEEGDDLPKLAKKQKAMLDKVVGAIEDEEEIDVVPTKAANDDEDVYDCDDPDEDDEDDDEPSGKPPVNEDDDDEDEDDDEEDEEDGPKPPPPAPRREEFVGMRELVAVLIEIAGLLKTLVGGKTAAAPKGGKESESEPAAGKPKAHKDQSLKNLVKFIRLCVTQNKGVTISQIVKSLVPVFPDYEKEDIEKRARVQVTRRMKEEGINIVEKDGKYFVMDDDE